MNIEERPFSPVLQTELDALLRAGLHTIGCDNFDTSPEKIEEQLVDFLGELEKAKSQFSDKQMEALLAQLGPVLAHLFITKFGWRWARAGDEFGHDFYFVVSSDRKLMVQPWTFLQDFALRENPGQAVKQLLSVPPLALQSEEIQQAELFYQDIGLAMVAMGALGNMDEKFLQLAMEDPDARNFMQSQGIFDSGAKENN